MRDIIENEQTTTEEIEAYLHEALDGSDQHHNRALQDIINNIGRRLGFEIKYGVYQGRSDTIGYDGHWTSTATENETHLIVKSKKTTAYSINPGQAGEYMNEFTDRDYVDRSQVYELYVIGEGDIETRYSDRSTETVCE